MVLGLSSQRQAAVQIGGLLIEGWQPEKLRWRPSSARKITCSSKMSESVRLPWAGPGVGKVYGSCATQRTQYVVDFHKAPFYGLGLTFASDPETGEYTVDDIIEDSPAAFSQIQVGDRLRMVSFAFDSSVQNQACQSPRHQERVRLLFERPSEWELQMQSLPLVGARLGSIMVSQSEKACQAGKPLCVTFARPGKVRGKQSEWRAARPKSHNEQAALLCSLIQEAVELPPLPLFPASQRRWALEFEGDTLRTLRRMPDNCGWSLLDSSLFTKPTSNIIPFPAFYHSGSGLPYTVQPASHRRGSPTHAIFALPWLIMASGHLGTRDVETVASACGLTRLLDLDLDSARLHGNNGKSSGGSEPSALVRSAAALQRLVVRRGGTGTDSNPAEPCCILVHTAHSAAETELATVLAAWLHWFGRMDLQQALQESHKALGYEADASTIAAASKLLLDACCEVRRRVRLSWPYGGGSVEVAGDVVGGWHVRTPLQECPGQLGSYTDIMGLEPGTYRYKFIVDGMWVVDMALPAECDAEGNTNNVVHVPDCSAATLLPAQALSYVRLQAARLALTTKLGVGLRRS